MAPARSSLPKIALAATNQSHAGVAGMADGVRPDAAVDFQPLIRSKTLLDRLALVATPPA